MVTRTKLWTPSNRFSQLAGLYRSILEILNRIDGQLTTRTDDDTGVVTVESDSNAGHGITTSSTVDVYWQSGQRIGMSVLAVTDKAITVDSGAGDALPTLNDWVWVKVQGAGGTVFPLGDHIHGALTGSTLTSIGEVQVTLTASEAWNAWDKPAGRFVGIIPYLNFNGSDEQIDTPDIAYFTFGDGTDDFPLTFGALVAVGDTAADRMILTKHDTLKREYAFHVDGDDTPKLGLVDESADVSIAGDTAGGAFTMDTWKTLITTYPGDGGASAADSIAMYFDGVSVAVTAENNASYVAMEDLTGLLTIGATGAGANWYNGKMAIPFLVPREITSDQAAMLDHLIRGAAGLT